MQVQCFADTLPAPGPRPTPPVALRVAEGMVEATQRVLRDGSAGRREAIVLWAGRTSGDGEALISHLVEPVFVSGRDYLTIPLEERSAVVQFVREQQLLLFADLHTHPVAAFLSPADRARPFSARPGFYAVVIPEFARRTAGDGWRFYEAGAGTWVEVPAEERVDGWRL